MPFLVFRFVMGIGGTVFAMVFALIVGFLVFGSVDDISIQFTVTAIFTAFFLARTISDLWRMVLSPFLSQYRIPRFSDRDAKRLYYWAAFIATYDIVTVIFATWVGDFGLNYNVYALVYGVLTLVGAALNLLAIAFNARAISSAIRAGRARHDVSWLTRVLSFVWAPLAIGYVVFAWLELAFDLVLEHAISIPLIAGFYMVLMSIIVVYGVINYGIEQVFERRRKVDEINLDTPDGEQGGEPSDGQTQVATHTVLTFEGLARRVAGVLAFGVGAFALIRIWRPETVWTEDSWNDRMLDVAVIMFIGYVVYHFFRIWIDSKIAEETVDEAEGELGDEGGEAGATRLATLLPLFRGAILAVVVVSIVLIALMEAGINVSPLFAGAGVVGLAVGFGSQTLVRDIFSGAFFLLDDAFRKGEYIDIGDVKGTVEKISVRSFQLRHHLGALNTIPFGEIRVLTNYSRDWVIMKLPLRVTYDTDVEQVRKLIKKLGQELLTDPVIGENFIQPLKSQGVIEMQDSAMIIRVKFMTKPGDQWLVRKKVYEEIRALFAKEGIHFAHREVTVRLAEGNPDNLSPQQKEAVTGAVQAAIDEDYLDDIGPGGDDR
jgi:small-conductance mechanosensitive channel